VIRKSIIFLLTLAAVAAAVLWPLGYRGHEPTDWSKLNPDLATRLLRCCTCGYIMGRHLRVPLWAGHRAFLQTHSGRITLAHVRPYRWHPKAPLVSKRLGPITYGQYSLSPAELPAVIYTPEQCEVLHTEDDLFTSVTIPVWALLLSFGAYPAIAFARGPLRRYRRRRRGLCLTCGYDLIGNVTGVCSECGEATELDP